MVDMKRMMGGALASAPQQQKKRGAGDFLADFVINYGAASGNPLAGSIIQNRVRDQRLAAQRQAQERLYDRKRADGLADAKELHQYKIENPAPTALERNVTAYQGMSPEMRQAAGEYYDMVTPKLVQGADKQYYPVRRPPAKPVGKLTPIQNGSPEGEGSVVTRQQYMAAVQAMGKEKTDAWLARNNIRVGQ